jgi:branched-chain amino acid transport system substrate-binding protein
MWRLATKLAPALPLCALALVSALSACGRTRAPVVVAAVGHWSGPEEQAMRQGIELAVADVSAAGGIDGRPLQVVFKDDDNDNATAARVAQDLVKDPSVIAVIGHGRSDPTLVAMRVYDGVMPVVTARFTSPDISGLSRWVFQLVPTDSAYAAAVVQFAARHDWHTAAVVFNNSARGRASARYFKELFPGDVLSMDPATFPQPLPGDMKVLAEYHRLRGPDLVFMPIGNERAPDYVRAAQQEGLRSAVIGWDVWGPVTSDPSLGGEFYRLEPFDLAGTRAQTQQFITNFRKANNAAPDAFAALGYDAVRLIAHAAASGTNRRSIRDAIAGLTPAQPYQGVTGPISFSPDGTLLGPQPVIVPLRAAARASMGS